MPTWRQFLLKLNNFLRPGRAELELRREIDSHLALIEDEFQRRGMTPDEARLAARRAFGSIEQTKELHREERSFLWLERAHQDIQFASRALRKNFGFSVLTVMILALGIGGNAAIFSVLHSLSTKSVPSGDTAGIWTPSPFADPKRTVSVAEVKRDDRSKTDLVSPWAFAQWKDRVSAFEQIAGWRFLYLNLSGLDKPEQVQGLTVTAPFLSLLGAEFQSGRNFLPEEEQFGHEKVAILSSSLWNRRFGSDPNLVGQQIFIESQPYTVVGILSPAFRFIRVLDRPLDIYLALPIDRDIRPGLDHSLFVYGRLKAGISLDQAQTELDSFYRNFDRQFPQPNSMWTASVTSQEPNAWPLYKRAAAFPSVLLSFAAAGLVLAIACVNIASLMLARATFRRKEMAVRAALGASRLRLVRQLLTESVLLALIGGVGGILCAIGGIHLLNVYVPDQMLRRIDDFKLDITVLAFSVFISTVSGLICGVLPALRSARVPPNEALNESGRSSTGIHTNRIGNFLVTSQMALATVLLTSALLLLQSSLALQHRPRGLDLKNVLTLKISLPSAKYPEGQHVSRFYDDVVQRIQRLPGIQSASVISFPPMARQSIGYPVRIENRVSSSPDTPLIARYAIIGPEYFQTMRIPLLAGREFRRNDVDERRGVAIISANTARLFWPNSDPIGRQLRPDFPNERLFWIPESRNVPLTVVGIVGDVRENGRVEGTAPPLIYLPYLQNPVPLMHIVVRTASDPLGFAPLVQEQVWSVDKDQPIADIQTIEEIVAYRFVSERLTANLIMIFATAAVLLTAIGICGMLSYAVSQKRHEIAIRVALGARQSDISKSITTAAFRLALAGVGSGLILSVGLRNVLAHFLYGIGPTDPITFIAVSVLLTAVALLAGHFPARRATTVDPMVVLRGE
ncbi:MAG TPA: ABC transporter permease [Terriglobia bacterium]|nr:ABC transporter permease [Terriglobia bacterium]